MQIPSSYARDTDIFSFTPRPFEKMPCKNLWLKAGTYKKPKYFPIHELHQDLPKSQIESILAFHAITGCDSVSFIAGHSKKSAWKVFGTHYELLCDLGKAELTSEVFQSAEKFICFLYNLNDIDKCDKARVVMFCKGRSQESLPPTSDAALLHIKHAHYQSMVWVQAHLACPVLLTVTDMGWMDDNGKLVPELITLPPIPGSCSEIVLCGCVKGCLSQRCSCRKIGVRCTEACKCFACLNETQCRNSAV